MLTCSEIAVLNSALSTLNCNIQQLLVNQQAAIDGDGFTTTSPIAYNTLTKVISITQASASSPGYVSAVDWATFNGKVNTASNVGGGSQAFKQKTGVNLEFRSFLGTAGEIIVTQNADDITLSIDPTFSGGGGGGGGFLNGNLFS